MNYSSGDEVRLGDLVQLYGTDEGTVVCSLDTNEFSDVYPEAEWAYLRQGVLILSEKMGVVHFVEQNSDLKLIARKAK